LWYNGVTEGLFNKRVIEKQVITNYRVEQNGFFIDLAELDDIPVMNQHRVSQKDAAERRLRRYSLHWTDGNESLSFQIRGLTYHRFYQFEQFLAEDSYTLEIRAQMLTVCSFSNYPLMSGK
jgi:hypothetical protein